MENQWVPQPASVDNTGAFSEILEHAPVAHRTHFLRGFLRASVYRRRWHRRAKPDPLRHSGGGDRMHEAPVGYLHRSRSPTQFRQMAAAIIWTARFVHSSRRHRISLSGASVRRLREDPLRSRDEPSFGQGCRREHSRPVRA